jgi:hypothetical protein
MDAVTSASFVVSITRRSSRFTTLLDEVNEVGVLALDLPSLCSRRQLDAGGVLEPV